MTMSRTSRKAVRALVLSAVALLSGSGAFGESPPADPAAEIFLDATKPEAARLGAAEQMRYPSDETFAAMLRILADPTESDQIRWAARSVTATTPRTSRRC